MRQLLTFIIHGLVRQKGFNMKINFNMDIRIEAWAKALGYAVVGDKLIHSTVIELKDFEECVSDYISESLESGTNSAALEEIFFANDDEQHILQRTRNL